MLTRNNMKTIVMSLNCLMILFLLSTFIGAPSVNSVEEYEYYGFIPDNIYFASPKHELHGAIDPTAGFEVRNETIGYSGLIIITALKDNTEVKVFSLTNNSLVSQTQLNTMQKHYVELPNGTMFKVVSSNFATVLLLNGGVPNATAFEGTTPATFFPSVDGTYFGKEFMFVASQGLSGQPYRIFAFEDSKITIEKEDGSTQSLNLKANEFENIGLSAFKAYKITSTGNIMVHTTGIGWANHRSFFVPAIEGGFLGKTFFSDSASTEAVNDNSWDTSEDYGFRISALEDTKVQIWDAQLRRLVLDFEVKGGVGIGVKPKADEMMVKSDKPITCFFTHNGSIARSYSWSYGAGVTYLGVNPNEDTPFFLPTNASVEAYVFAYEDSLVTVDDLPITIKKDQSFLLRVPGNHKIRSDKKIVVEVIHWPLYPDNQGVQGFGVIVPCVQTINLIPDVKPAPMTEEGFPMTYIMIGAIAAVVIAVVGFLVVKRRPKK